MLAERVGFEPTVPETGTPDFESGAFDHSATSPEYWCAGVSKRESLANVRFFRAIPNRSRQAIADASCPVRQDARFASISR